jgi:hypothetical protein
LDVTRADGEAVGRTALGNRYKQTFDPSGPRRKNVPIELEPGGEYEENPPHCLNELFDLSRPGVYTLQITYEEGTLPWKGRLPSNKVTFEVVAAKPL